MMPSQPKHPKTNSQACEPCAKRKVRCDRGDPCSNCKRRKRDSCVYPALSPVEKIKKLEALVRSLGGDPEEAAQSILRDGSLPEPVSPHCLGHRVTEDSHIGNSSNETNAPLLSEKSHSHDEYSEAWTEWGGQVNERLGQSHRPSKTVLSSPLAQQRPSVLSSILRGDDSVELSARHPALSSAEFLWTTYTLGLEPLIKIAFDWELEPLRLSCVDRCRSRHLTAPEHAFVFALYFITVNSLSEDVCIRELGASKADLLSEYRLLCEQALYRSNFVRTTDIKVLQALILYIFAGVDILDTPGLWTLMGMTIRIAERLGLHRDGSCLGLPPADTERRRRIWWQLQHLDLFIGIRSRRTPLSFLGTWDARLPLNIEDSDLGPDTIEPPLERKSLTGMSFCLWTFWILNRQRSHFSQNGNGVGLSWVTDRSVAEAATPARVNEVEEELNKNFLQYCDPIKPLDILVQLHGRATLCGFRRMIYHPVNNTRNISELDSNKRHEKLVETSLQGLEYEIAFYSNPVLKPFRWQYKRSFPWGAFITVIVEASRKRSMSSSRRIWALLAALYSVNPYVWEVEEDQKRYQSAEMIVSAWKASGSHARQKKPTFVTDLEIRLSDLQHKGSEKAKRASQPATSHPSVRTPVSIYAEEHGVEADWMATANPHNELDILDDLDFDQIDWAFWESFSGEDYLLASSS